MFTISISGILVIRSQSDAHFSYFNYKVDSFSMTSLKTLVSCDTCSLVSEIHRYTSTLATPHLNRFLIDE